MVLLLCFCSNIRHTPSLSSRAVFLCCVFVCKQQRSLCGSCCCRDRALFSTLQLMASCTSLWLIPFTLDLSHLDLHESMLPVIDASHLCFSGVSLSFKKQYVPTLASKALERVTLEHTEIFPNNVAALGPSHCPNLKALDINWCVGNASLAGISQLTGLEQLSLKACHGIDRLNFEALPALVSLRVENLDFQADCSVIPSCLKLEALDISHISQDVDLAWLTQCPALKCLVLDGIGGEGLDLSVLTKMDRLETASFCHSLLNSLAFLSNTEIVTLDLSGCCRISDLTPLGEMSRLENLEISSCVSVTDLSPLGACPGLKLLIAQGLERLDENALAGLTPGCSSLRTIDLSDGSADDVSLAPLALLPSLEILDLSCCNLTSVDELRGSPALRVLDVSHCEALPSVSALLMGKRRCPMLKTVENEGCSLSL
jgi:hypothetical protein